MLSVSINLAFVRTYSKNSGTSSSGVLFLSGGDSVSGNSVSSSSRGQLTQIPSNPTDFPGNSPNLIKVAITGAHKDIVGAWHVTGEITNVGNLTLNFVQVTAHLYDSTGKLIGDAIGSTSPSNIDPGHTATFDSLATSDQINGNPASYRLSYDWS